MDALTAAEIDAFVDRVLAEDDAANDITTQSVVDEGAAGRGAVVARGPLVLAGLDLAAAIYRKLDPSLTWTPKARDGDFLEAGAVIAEIAGPARAMLTGERPALNTLQHLSGIATLTRAYAEAIAGTKAELLDTRKTVPGLRRLAKYAAAMGGAHNHRMSLSEAVLIKDNHIAVAGGLTAAVAAARARVDEPIEVECDNLDQVDEALALGVTHLLLDNMSPDELRAAVARAAGKATLEASGGITLETIRAVAETGVDFISVGRLTQSAPAVDIALDFTGDTAGS